MKDIIAEALQEAILFMEAPADSPRQWAVSRGNLTKLLTDAVEQRKKEQSSLSLRRIRKGMVTK